MESYNKNLKWSKRLGREKMPKEHLIEANKETGELLREIFEKVYRSQDISHSWEEGEILRLYKGKGLKGRCSNERGITLAMCNMHMTTRDDAILDALHHNVIQGKTLRMIKNQLLPYSQDTSRVQANQKDKH